MTGCPSEATLRLIGTDAVGEATFTGLEGHVEQCPDCQKILEAAAKAVSQTTHLAPARDTPPTLPGLVIERELGRGGGSVVYLAWEPALSRHVAVKLFPRDSLFDPHVREHWHGEARALSRVPHDHVVAVFRVDETEEWLWLVMEFVPGGTLKDRLTEPLPPRDAARLTETIAQAVGYFHTRGLCHLDLKPSNILLDGEPGSPVGNRLSQDFRLRHRPTRRRAGHDPDRSQRPQGHAVLHGSGTSRLPSRYDRPRCRYSCLGRASVSLVDRPSAISRSVERRDARPGPQPRPRSPARLNSRISRDLETICLTCLEKAPNRRYKTAEALAGDLRLWLEGHPIKARRVSPIGHAWRWCRRHPAVAGLLVTLAMTLATGFVALFVLLNRVAAEGTRLIEARRHAEAYEKFSAKAADQLVSLFQATIRGHANATPDQMTAALLKLHSSTSDLKTQGIVPSSTIGILEEEIAWALRSVGKIEEAREPLRQAIVDLKQSLATNPEDKEAWDRLADAFWLSADLSDKTGQLEDTVTGFEQTVAMRMASERGGSLYFSLPIIYCRLEVLADRLGRRGQTQLEEQSRRLGQQILRYLLGSETEVSADGFHPGPGDAQPVDSTR